MSWHGVHGHDALVDRFRRALRHGRLASTFLFVGPAGIGKRRFARTLAQALLCERHPDEALDPCEVCPACQQVRANTHPDLLEVAKPDDKAFIPLELLIGDREHRMQEGLCHDIALKPYAGGRRIALINDADHLNVEGANCLLKTLEEPPPKSVIILIGTSQQKQLPTIRSRCQLVRFQPLSTALVEQLLLEQQLCESPQQARELALLSEGSLERAAMFADPAVREFRAVLLQKLAAPPWVHTELVPATTALIEAAGKDSPSKRTRLKQVIGFALELYQAIVENLHGQPAEEPLVRAAAAKLAPRLRDGHLSAADCAEICLRAIGHVDSNANQATLLEWWLDELAVASRAPGSRA